MRIINFFTVLFILLPLSATPAHAQQINVPSSQKPVISQAGKLNEIVELIERKTQQRIELETLLVDVPEGKFVEENKRLDTLNDELSRLNESFRFVALGDTNVDILNTAEETHTTWQEDLVEIIDPLMDSLKTLTEKPRQIADLREKIRFNDQKTAALDRALASTQTIVAQKLDAEVKSRLETMRQAWQDEKAQLVQDRLISNAHLDDLTNADNFLLAGLWPRIKRFLGGRGLTLLMATVAAIATWALMRLLWLVYETRFTSRDTRRHSTWYRLIAYSYYLVTILVIIFTVVIILYAREDLLLLALAFIVIAGAALSFRQFLPQYIAEARLLLNLGSVREDERVIYNGLPWQIMSLNLFSILRNPSLEGVVRLPLNTLAQLASRPINNKLWFPTEKGDYVLLPDSVLGCIKHQTPDLVEISVRAGMSITYPTPDFYRMGIFNLSRDNTFAVQTCFGLDYSLQSLSLNEVPRLLELSVRSVLVDAGYASTLTELSVELTATQTSSLEFLILATMKSEVAKDYTQIERLLIQACVEASNRNHWTIPYPQVTVHTAGRKMQLPLSSLPAAVSGMSV